jgi:Z1 domain
LKKNVSVLKKVYSSLKNINTTATQTKINYPALIIDDEADNASINTNKADDDPTKINKYIRNLLSLFTRSSYVGFTATPFANVFISYDKKDEMLNDDLFPRDFIYALNSPSNYCGAKKYFVEKNNNIEFIKDANDEIFPMRHTKEWDGDRLFGSLYEAIRSFLLANAIRDIRDVNKNTHRSMLINMSRFTKVQSSIMNIVEEYFKEVKRSVKQTHKLPASVALSNPIIQSLKQTFENEYTNLEVNVEKITWQKVFSQLYDSISKIKVVVVNSSKNSSKLNYDDAKDGLRVIAVGGLALSRGLTLEGLMTSYFYRNTATFDVLMQMGRWFGYREGYADLCRIWLTETSYYYYRYIYLSTEALKSDIKTMGQEKRKPEDFGIRVMNDSIELGITAANKMRNTLQRVEKTFFGSVFETPYIVRDLDAVENNIDNTLAFLKKLSMEQRDYSITQHPYFRDVNVEDVKKLLSSLNIPNANATYFDKKQILSQMKQNASSISKFDVLIIGGKTVVGGVQNPHRFRLDSLDINIPLVGRSFDIKDDTIRMSKSRLRLGGSSDTRYGLSDDQIPLTHTKAQDYLIEDRNPLLIIYFIRPTNVADEADFIYSFDSDNNDKNAQKKLIKELGTRKYGYLVGFGLGIPRKLGVSTKSTMFTVNKTVNYYDKDHDNESEEIS